MKELSIEEKAKAYDKAFAYAKILLKIIGNATLGNLVLKNEFEKMFPELKENEDPDERIRKALTKLVTNYPSMDLFIEYDIHLDEVLAYLEKQDEKTDVIENFDTEFEKQVSHLIASVISKEHEYNQGYVKWVANALLNYAKHELEKQGEQNQDINIHPSEYINDMEGNGCYLKNTAQAWSKEDEKMHAAVLKLITDSEKENGWNCVYCNDKEIYFSDIIAWLKSLKPHSHWKPSDKQIMALRWVLNHIPYDSYKEEISGLLEQLQKLRNDNYD